MTGRDLRQVRRAAVFKGDARAGTLIRGESVVTFSYLPDYAGPAVAHSLPREVGLHAARGGGAVPPFFAGLLPEGRRLSAVRNSVKTSADDELTLLLAVGSQTIGDVRVVPEEDGPEGGVEPVPVGPAPGEVVFDELFEAVIVAPHLDPAGLPGYQAKISGEMLNLPVRYEGRAWILKLNPPEYSHVVENEHFFLRAAALCGIPTAESGLITDREGKRGLLVARFDRVGGEQPGRLRALAQEDACQVMARYPSDKYLLSTEEVVAGLAAACSAPVVAARALLQQVAFAYLSCNGDAHAKNFSVLQHLDGEWSVSPAYDLPTTHPYGDTTLALRINGKDREDVGRDDFVALGEEVGVRRRAVQSLLDELIASSARWLPRLDELPFDQRQVHKLRKAINYRLARLGG